MQTSEKIIPESAPRAQSITKQDKLSHRLVSLDVFRGITVAAMILVNNPGSWSHIYAPLEHAHWNGCTPTDLIFPFFLFIVGVSIVYAISGKKDDITLHPAAIKSIAIRSLKLFALGFFLSLYPKFNFETVRILGVLQRIGIVFLVASLIYLKSDRKTIIWLFGSFLVVYYLLMNFMPVPGAGPANLEPETNLAAWIDRLILTTNHTWALSKTWDPEGLLSTVPAISTALFGVLVGIWMKRKDVDAVNKVVWMFVYGAAAIVAGLIWDMFFPINKSLWTSSYVLYAGGLATAALALCYWLIDIQGHKQFTKPFVAFGVNAITAFFLSAFIVKTLWLIKLTNAKGEQVNILKYLYDLCIVPYFSPINASLIHALIWVVLLMALMLFMYKRKIIIKV
ncbi:acyltransferase family protein [Solitalea koreensis]|uniref:Predicted acyltransferase n=1 Tax=Solitalea koreensis TaxID=543615 RepID=A0A521B0X7_9SPHI|nr:DUF5009 domain-containing protein [Solitalea koreensis]SMO40661.1 Predicted acyltransferase [Solitalea koreensis]